MKRQGFYASSILATLEGASKRGSSTAMAADRRKGTGAGESSPECHDYARNNIEVASNLFNNSFALGERGGKAGFINKLSFSRFGKKS